MFQLVKVSDATTHAQAGRTGTAPYELFVGVSQCLLGLIRVSMYLHMFQQKVNVYIYLDDDIAH